MGSRQSKRQVPTPKNIVAGGWIKPTEPPIRVASQAHMPGMPPVPKQYLGYVTMSADGRPQQQEKSKNG